MSMFDDFVVNAKSAAAVVSKKAGDVWDTSKQRISAASLRGELNKKYSALGEAVYNNEPTQTIDELKAQIAEIKQSLADIDEILAANKKGSVCPACGQKAQRDAQFCAFCGAEIPRDNVVCKACGAELKEGFNFCTNCGAPVEVQQEAQSNESNQPEQ